MAWLQAAVLSGLFLGGGLLGVVLARWLVPGSYVAQFVGLFSFSLPFAIGMHLWLGTALVVEAWRALSRQGRPLGPQERTTPPGGAIVFVPVCAALVACAGGAIGLIGSSLGVMPTVGLYLLLGVIYGTWCWLVARAGYLPFPPG